MIYLRRLPKVIKNVIVNPCFVIDLFTYFRNDLYSLLGKYKYDYPIIFIAGLPKSGTTWLETQLARVPGYNIRPINDPDKCTYDHDVCDSVFSSLPQYGYSVVKLHTKYSEDNIEVIKRYVPKLIVMIRDLRDMCVSRYFHVKSEKPHRHCELYNREPLENGMMHCIEIIGDEYVCWVKDWLKITKENPDMIMLITYEELNCSPMSSFKKIIDFYHLPVDDSFARILVDSKLKKEKNLEKELSKSVGLRRKSTARRGVVGDWMNYFSPAHKERFKEIAGDLLIELGYEKDLDW